MDELQRGVKPDQEWFDKNFGNTSYDWTAALTTILTPAR